MDYLVVTAVSQRYYTGVTVVLQWCYSGVTVVLQPPTPSQFSRFLPIPDGLFGFHSGVTVVLQWCYSGVTVILQWYYSDITAANAFSILSIFANT
jgi:hypothetical protein